MNLDNSFIKFKDSFSKDVKLSNYSWFNLGGNAEYFYKAQDKEQLIEFLAEAKSKNLKTTIIGAGSNILFSRSLEKSKEKEKSFFALISLQEKGEWLTARGQGGAVVIWLRD